MNQGKLKDVTLEELQKYIDDKWSYESIGAAYGVSGAAIRKRIVKLGGKLPKRREVSEKETFNKGLKFTAQSYCVECGKPVANGYKYCSNKCQMLHQDKDKVQDWKEHPEHYEREDMPNFIRRYLIAKYNGCQLCGWHEINPTTGNMPLEVHHIDGNCLNNREDNLQLLCPNCHSLTPNAGALNRGNSKRYKWKECRKKYSSEDIS